MGTMNINKTVSLYNKVMVWLVSGLTLVGLLTMQLSGWNELLTGLIVSAVFCLVSGVAYIQGWKALANRSAQLLPKYHLAGSALRLITACVVMLVVCVLNRANPFGIKLFAVVFMVYYVVMLIFDALFFAKVSKFNNQ
jgi:hypothetical protein